MEAGAPKQTTKRGSGRPLGARLRGVVAAGVVALVGGVLGPACASPTLPLPPPDYPEFRPSSETGKVHLSSKQGAEPHAIVVIYNRNPAIALDQRVSGAEADDGGSWDADVEAQSGDSLDITQEYGTTRSPPITVKVP